MKNKLQTSISVNMLWLLHIGFILTTSLPAFCDVQRGKIHPVIFIPGAGGSQVDAKLNKPSVVNPLCKNRSNDYINIWLNPMSFISPLITDCWVDNMRLVYDNKTRTTSNSPGVEVRIPGWGDPFAVEWIDRSKLLLTYGSYFKNIADALVKLGYERNISIRGAPYDFRKAPNENQEFFVNLKVLVEETYKMNNNTPVVLIAHSKGGPMSLHFLHQQSQTWKDQYIRALVALSGAWGGTVRAIKVYAVGEDLGSVFLPAKVMRKMLITAPFLAWMLPSSLFWKPDEVLVETYERNYTWSDMKDFFLDINYPVGWEMWRDVYNFTQDFSAPGVEVHCLNGYNVPTVEKLVYKKGKFPNGTPSFVFGDGDGTLNKQSLEGCLRWKGNQNQPIYHHTFPKMDHMDIVKDSRIIKYIANLVVSKG